MGHIRREINLVGQLEALLFLSPQPLKLQYLADFLEVDQAQLVQAGQSLQSEYLQSGRGLSLLIQADQYQLVTAASLGSLVSRFKESLEKVELSKPALETLTIIAYQGPISKTDLEQIRGVNCSLVLKNLLSRGLILKTGVEQNTVYEVTLDFWRSLGIEGAQQLPPLKKV